MKKLYPQSLILLFLAINAPVLGSGYSYLLEKKIALDTTSKQSVKTTTKITDTRAQKPSFLNGGVNVTITPFKPVNIKQIAAANTSQSNAPKASPDLKVVNNVKVYPNPVAEQLNLSYNVTKDSNVTIKIMDVLGNEIATLLNQRIQAGEQNNSFSIASRLNSGYYFIRLIVGNETVIKRISIL